MNGRDGKKTHNSIPLVTNKYQLQSKTRREYDEINSDSIQNVIKTILSFVSILFNIENGSVSLLLFQFNRYRFLLLLSIGLISFVECSMTAQHFCEKFQQQPRKKTDLLFDADSPLLILCLFHLYVFCAQLSNRIAWLFPWLLANSMRKFVDSNNINSTNQPSCAHIGADYQSQSLRLKS